MTAAKENLNSVFDPAGGGLGADVLGVLESMLRLHSLTADELFIKWEVYCLKMGGQDTKLDLDTARMFAKDVQDGVEREYNQQQHQKSERKKPISTIHATPRGNATGDVFGMYVCFCL